MNEALGMVEVIGYACAVSVADTMVKTAAVDIQGLQRAKGSGWLTIKVTGSVSAVEASVNAGTAQAQRNHLYVASKVIARLGTGLDSTFLPQPKPPVTPTPTPVTSAAPTVVIQPASVANSVASTSTSAIAEPSSATATSAANSAAPKATDHYTCNLCKDPACPRKKGEPRASCIHFNETEAEQKNNSTHKK
ncbi:BMC domain-containing protein [Loigolactobacillus jiayinensis]|uniref:BMC domain-containing protein n=1 Tax=Loigolactobacillus jiayinensis TaxID=2486016 RepID=A0ABW1RE79_9LACO|nr:BMC domain-containing protein [Loigolactobacillus jiayinensis]